MSKEHILKQLSSLGIGKEMTESTQGQVDDSELIALSLVTDDELYERLDNLVAHADMVAEAISSLTEISEKLIEEMSEIRRLCESK